MTNENFENMEIEFEEELATCSCCGEDFPVSEMTESVDSGNLYCEDCANEELYYCERCGNYTDLPNSLEDTGRRYCESCFDYIKDWEAYRCNHCGKWFRYSESGNWDRYDEWYCESCIDDGHGHFRDSSLIGDYHDFKCDGDINFFGSEHRKENIYMGFELEIDKGDSRKAGGIAEYIVSNFGDFFHCEEDGSLDTGFEIISQPASINYHLDNMENYKYMFKEISDNTFRSHDAGTCGLHIHLDKEYFEDKIDSATAKMLYIFEKHWDNLCRFSRRKNSQLHWCSRYGSSPAKVVKDRKHWGSPGRYYAVNLDNYDTIEIRMWRGTLNPITFEATIRFTARLAEICKTKSAVEIYHMSFEKLLGDDEIINAYWETVRNRNV